MEACSKAMAVLSGDDAHDLFSKTLGFVQKRSAAESKRRTQASKILSAAAQKNRNPRLSQLAYSVTLDAFTKVKKAMDDMIGDLMAEQAAEVKHKDFCVDEFNTNQLQTEQGDKKKESLEAKIDDLTMTIKDLTTAIDTLKSEITELQVQMKRAGENRESENKEFQTLVAEQRGTQKLLMKALSILKEVYGKRSAAGGLLDASLVQEKQTPPAAFKTYSKNKNNGGVMGMIQNIIDDAKAMEAEAIRSEEDSQKAYEDFVKETNASIFAKADDMTNKKEDKGKTEVMKVEAEKELDSTNLELEQLATYKAELHASCDFTMKNFEIRQTSRTEEMEGLKEAIVILKHAQENHPALQ
jgi:FtsZ-binding cell division protein ZapB